MIGMAALLPIVPAGRLRAVAGPARSSWPAAGLGLLVSQLNNFTLAPIYEERISEAAGVNSAAGSFGLSFGLALAGGLMLASAGLGVHDPGRGQPGVPAASRPSRSRRPSTRTPS